MILSFQRIRLTPIPSRCASIRRMAWDCRLEAWRSREKLRKVRAVHKGKSAIILCNGPSLLKADFDGIARSGVFVFGLNKINLLFDKTALRPHAIVAVNPHVIEQNRSFFNATSLPLYLDEVGRKHVGAGDNVTFLHSANIRRFAKDCSLSVSQGHTVTYVALTGLSHGVFASRACRLRSQLCPTRSREQHGSGWAAGRKPF